MRSFLAFVISILLATASAASQSRFYPDDPLWRDQDQHNTPQKPAELDLSDLFDRFSHIFHDFGDPNFGEAENVNTLDEVPDSNWFTNRHGLHRMPLDELLRGPYSGDPPDPDQTWSIFRSKSQGLTPGFHIVDERGVRYVIKVDPRGNPELASGAEMIATQIFYALGYHVPENYIVYLDPQKLAIKPGTEVVDEFGDRLPLTPTRLQRMLKGSPRDTRGRIRVLASKYLPGAVLGPFRYYETRSDDPNDVILHENRRELRGLRLFAAWLNHDDTRAQNTQDSWVQEGGVHFVRHYLIDFGSTLGSGTVETQLPNLAYHYWLDTELVKKSVRAFGFRVPEYRKVKWPPETKLPGVGRIEAEFFDPVIWRNDYPNPAFVRMTSRDAFWAAKIIARFTREEVGAIVKLAQLSDPRAEEYLLDTLVARQRRCVEAYLTGISPLDQFRVSNSQLHFTNLADLYQLSSPGTSYRARWMIFDNQTEDSRKLSGLQTQTGTAVPLPSLSGLKDEEYAVLEISAIHAYFPHWEKVSVYLRLQAGEFEVVGIER